MNATPDLELVGVSKRFGDHLAVAEVSFAVAPGEFFSILGRSEEHTSELQSQSILVCRLLLEKKKPAHFHRPVERAFIAEERNHVTILIGGYTWKHADLIRAVFQGCGYRRDDCPLPDVSAFHL